MGYVADGIDLILDPFFGFIFPTPVVGIVVYVASMMLAKYGSGFPAVVGRVAYIADGSDLWKLRISTDPLPYSAFLHIKH